MAGLVADHRADAAIVDPVIAIGVEERRLQDRGREVDGVGGRAVIGIDRLRGHAPLLAVGLLADVADVVVVVDRKSTRLNSSHPSISYAVFCLKKKKEGDTNCSYRDTILT